MKGPLFHLNKAERENILETLRQALKRQPQVLFAYVHGSFLEDRPFHDVDLAVYLDDLDDVQEQDPDLLALDLAAGLEAAVAARPEGRIPVDVRALNRAPLGFRYQAFRGRLLFSRDEDRRAELVVYTVSRYLDIKPLRDRALKEAMTGWT